MGTGIMRAAVLLLLCNVLSHPSSSSATATERPLPAPAVKSTTMAMEKACNLTLDPNFCLVSLQADPRSRSADLSGLAAVALDLAVANATSTIAKLSDLRASASGSSSAKPSTRNKLEACLILYRNAVPPLRLAAEFLAEEHVEVARAMMEAPVFAPGSCGQLLGRVLAKENDDLFNLMLISRRIAEALTP
ncbi:pectinesterase inhibitor-like [Zingiber officinale]|uniref:Pectinesterase inhibitor domain-containing protein n=1 Tax=Zingiber officinale TaxID=94328 RepID=A0A8J5GSV8_ZINOF|nr:pectinesterase inhibitor-like [Zingiber officinale]KAG6512137.1 hypothetical protein ZIOFF_030232 [Zingiber officinale]